MKGEPIEKASFRTGEGGEGMKEAMSFLFMHNRPSTTLFLRYLVLSTHFIIFEAATTEWYLYLRLFMAPIPPLTRQEEQQATVIFVFCVILDLSNSLHDPFTADLFPSEALNYWSCLNRHCFPTEKSQIVSLRSRN